MKDNIVEFKSIKKKVPFKEKVKAWWDKNEEIILFGIFLITTIGAPIIGLSITNKKEAILKEKYGKEDTDSYPDYTDDIDGFSEETIREIYIHNYDSGTHTPGGLNPKTLVLETDYSNLGYLGEQIVKHFDIDPDEEPYICIDFTTFSHESNTNEEVSE